MSERPEVVLALSPPVEQTIEPLLFGADAAVRIATTVEELAALERVVDRAGGADGVLVSADLPGLTATLLERVRARGLRVVGIATSDHDAALLHRLPLDSVLPLPLAPAVLEAALRPALELASLPAAPARAEGAAARAGGVVAVVGGRRSPGASELAASLAALAGERWPALLVELDLLGGGLALRLGADAGKGSTLGVLRAAARGREGLAELVERSLVERPGWPPTLLAARDPQRLCHELELAELVRPALEALAASVPLVVADSGFLTNGADGDPLAHCHGEALAAADAVVLVLGAREGQLEHGLVQLDLLLDRIRLPAERLRVVCNAVGGPGALPRAELAGVLGAALLERQLALDAILPWDGRALARSTRTGLPLAHARPRGPYARAVRRLLTALFLPTAPVARRGKRRLAPPPELAVRRAEESESCPS